MATRREQAKRLSRELGGVPVVTPTHPPRGFLARVNAPAVEKARRRHDKNEIRKRGGLKR